MEEIARVDPWIASNTKSRIPDARPCGGSTQDGKLLCACGRLYTSNLSCRRQFPVPQHFGGRAQMTTLKAQIGDEKGRRASGGPRVREGERQNTDPLVDGNKVVKVILQTSLKMRGRNVCFTVDVPNGYSIEELVGEIRKNGHFIDADKTDWIAPHIIQRIWKS
jgi:hypothetical protein